MPQLTPADRILETTRELKHPITQQPKAAPLDEITAIEYMKKWEHQEFKFTKN